MICSFIIHRIKGYFCKNTIIPCSSKVLDYKRIKNNKLVRQDIDTIDVVGQNGSLESRATLLYLLTHKKQSGFPELLGL